jgi:hypothetical protein
MLTSVLGSKFQDNYMGSRPDYQALMVRTRRFLPWPPLSPEKIAANEAKLAATARAEGTAAPVETPRPAKV